ncbi:MAG: hypothetical protein BMS9Abin05_2361 [Rhodothermia bacterium]|nr:MAG: hypothetical protein BMS9Abin05_2361 [Rhodothermia bacterium]
MRGLLRRLKRLVRAGIGKDIFPRVQVRYPTTRLGSPYGGWSIIAESLNRESIVYSFGVGEDISFDLALINEFGLTVHAFDPTPKSIAWVRKQSVPDRFILHEVGLADFDGEVMFRPPKNPDYISHTALERPETEDQSFSVPVKQLSSILTELGHNRITVLKMDIEGSEYKVIESLARSDIRPVQLLVEFHHRFPGVGLQETRRSLKHLREMGYKLFAISDTGEEFGFVYHPGSIKPDFLVGI